MEICNVTFIIQIINFWIFYYVVSKFLLRPFFDFVKRKAASRQALLADFAHQEATLKNLLYTKGAQLDAFRRDVYAKYAQQDNPICFVEPGILRVPETPEQTKRIVTCVSDYIVREVLHAHRD